MISIDCVGTRFDALRGWIAIRSELEEKKAKRVAMHVLRCLFARDLVLAAWLAFGAQAFAQTDPLPSWNDGPAKQAIVAFVQATTTQGSSRFVPPAERIATFDQDGTLWVEHPMYSQVMYSSSACPRWSRRSPSWRTSSRSRP